MSAYLAPSLVRLRDDINVTFPGRDRASDGWIGDPAHAARTSDHNEDSKGCVHALDVDVDDNDTTRDLRAELIAAAMSHPAVSYYISNGRIWSREKGNRPYDGENAHFAHVHISIAHTAAAENSTATWLAPRVVVVVKTKVQQARAKLHEARALLKVAGKDRPAAERAKRRVHRTLRKLPKQ